MWVRNNLLSLILGILGILVGHVVWHMYNDHLLIHAVVNALQQGQVNEKKTTP